MFEDLILTFYLFITIFWRMQLHILWWEYLMLSVNILCKQPLSSARIKSSNIVFIWHKLSLSCSICEFIKHKCSFKAIIILALNSPLIFSDVIKTNHQHHHTTTNDLEYYCKIMFALHSLGQRFEHMPKWSRNLSSTWEQLLLITIAKQPKPSLP